jgi:hypothetical protein
MEMRREVQLSGIPILWDTNLADADLLDLFKVISDDPELLRSTIEIHGFLALSVRPFLKTVPFKDGYCRCVGFKDHLIVTYRSSFDWELWQARQAEIEEHKQERRERFLIEKLLAQATDHHLEENALEAIQAGRFADAAVFIKQRLEHAKSVHVPVKDRFGFRHPDLGRHVAREVRLQFCGFPTADPAVDFLCHHATRWPEFIEVAECYYRFHCKAKEKAYAELDKLFRAAVQQFPSAGGLYKEICLFWERRTQLDLAIEYCRLAAERGLRDDTKTGFPSRLKRLLNRKEKAHPSAS